MKKGKERIERRVGGSGIARDGGQGSRIGLRADLVGEFVEDAVDERSRFAGAEHFCDLDGFIQNDGCGHIGGGGEFVSGEAKYVAVHGSESLEAVVFDECFDLFIESIAREQDAIDERFCEVARFAFDAVEFPESGPFFWARAFSMNFVCKKVLHSG